MQISAHGADISCADAYVQCGSEPHSGCMCACVLFVMVSLVKGEVPACDSQSAASCWSLNWCCDLCFVCFVGVVVFVGHWRHRSLCGGRKAQCGSSHVPAESGLGGHLGQLLFNNNELCCTFVTISKHVGVGQIWCLQWSGGRALCSKGHGHVEPGRLRVPTLFVCVFCSFAIHVLFAITHLHWMFLSLLVCKN